MEPLTVQDLWIVYNCGLSILSDRDLLMSETQWINTYNRVWHGVDLEAVVNACERLRKSNYVSMQADGIIALTEKGQKLWCDFANPKWHLSFSWACCDPSIEAWDYRIAVCAPSCDRLFTIVLDDINKGTYGFVDTENLVFQKSVSFHPLYWYVINEAVAVEFDAAFLESTRNAVSKREQLGFSDTAWHLSFEAAIANWRTET